LVDMLAVPTAIDVLWLVDGGVRAATTLRAWWGVGCGVADTIIELRAGVATDVAVGDTVEVQGHT